jgi:hypothetical protein
VQVFVHPHERVVVRLPHAAEVAGDRRRSVEMDVGSVRALGVERLDHAGADDRHGRGHRGQVAVRLLLLHLANADPAAGHQRPIGGRPASRGDHPREVVERADLEGHGHVVAEDHRLGPVSEDAPPEVRHADEGAAIALLGEPLEIGEVPRVAGSHPVQQRGQLARGPGLAVDLIRGAVTRDDGQQVVDDPGVGVQQERVEGVQPVRWNRQPGSQVGARVVGCRRGHSRLLARAGGPRRSGAGVGRKATSDHMSGPGARHREIPRTDGVVAAGSGRTGAWWSGD